jgi:hypothetical protein
MLFKTFRFQPQLAIILLSVFAVFQGVNIATAALVVSIQHVSVAPGGSGSLDVLISSDSVVGDSFQNYFLDFTISGAAQAADPINFVPSILPAPQLFATSPDYIFLGNSAEAAAPIGLDSVSDQPGSPVANDLITVVDLTDSGSDRTITLADGDFLLARLNFLAPLSATPGSVYNINLEVTSFFEDISFNQPSFNSNIGSITVSAVAVPEPSSLGVILIAGVLVGIRKHRQRKRPQRCQSA